MSLTDLPTHPFFEPWRSIPPSRLPVFPSIPGLLLFFFVDQVNLTYTQGESCSRQVFLSQPQLNFVQGFTSNPLMSSWGQALVWGAFYSGQHVVAFFAPLKYLVYVSKSTENGDLRRFTGTAGWHLSREHPHYHAFMGFNFHISHCFTTINGTSEQNIMELVQVSHAL